MSLRFLLLLSAALLAAFGARAQEPAQELSQRQVQAIEVIAYLQVTRKVCGYIVEPEIMRMTALDGDLTLDTELEQAALVRKLAETYEKFSGVKRVLACGDALEEYGPAGKRVKGLLKPPAEVPPEPEPAEPEPAK